MTGGQVERILSLTETDPSVWTRMNGLISVVLDSEANLFPGPASSDRNAENDKYYFDITNEVLLVKKYYPRKIISSRFKNWLVFNRDTIEVPLKAPGVMQFPGLAYRGETIPEPEVGDTVFTTSADTDNLTTPEKATIESIEYTDTKALIKLSKSLNYTGQTVCWAKSKYYNESQEDQRDSSVLFVTKPITDLPFDTCVGFDHISGFSFERLR